MNALTKASQPSTEVAVSDDDMIRVLGNSLYPGAQPDSIRLVLAWCKATGRDPMKKPVHIVPMWVKTGPKTGEMRDTLMPGIGTYRTDAARTGEYAGKTEPEFGPDVTRRYGENGEIEVTFPQWCKMTVFRMIGGQARPFPHKEYWAENYATAGRNTTVPNAMWQKRPYGQLAKCTEAQALRQAFPEETGNTNTMEEMEGKTFDGVTIEAKPEPIKPEREKPKAKATVQDADDIPSMEEEPEKKPAEKPKTLRDALTEELAAATSLQDVESVKKRTAVAAILRDGPESHRKVLQDMLDKAAARFPQPTIVDAEIVDDGFPGDDILTDGQVPEMHPDADYLIAEIRKQRTSYDLKRFLGTQAVVIKMSKLDPFNHGRVSDASATASMALGVDE